MSDGLVFDERPLRIYWELTRACDLACRHCRAEAIPGRDARELSTLEGVRLLEALAGVGRPRPHVVLTGGDPLKRPDFWELLEHGVALGLEVSVAPSGTPALTPNVVRRLAQVGVRAISLSFDGSGPARHDGFRGVPGCFERTFEAAEVAFAEGLPVQANSLVTGETLSDLPGIGALVAGLGAARWSLFFLIPVGRGRELGQLTPDECEHLLSWLWEYSNQVPFTVTTTEAPHYRRVALQRMRAEGRAREAILRSPVRHGFGIRDGNGIMFISHTGEVMPSGFLPLAVGNVRTASPMALYREAALFRRLRRPDRFGGRCGRCAFRRICGGSRARAYAATGTPFGEDPLCAYEPGALAAVGAEA